MRKQTAEVFIDSFMFSSVVLMTFYSLLPITADV